MFSSSRAGTRPSSTYRRAQASFRRFQGFATIGKEEPTTGAILTFDELTTYLSLHDDYLILSHSDPDGDAIGSELGLLEVLRHLGKKAQVLNSDACSEKFRVFDPEESVRSLEEGEPLPLGLAEMSLILIDTSDFHHTGRARDEILMQGKRVLIIDHHTPPSQLPCDAYIDDTAAASSQIVYFLAEHFHLRLTRRTAEALFMGIVFDTGSFIYPKTSAATFVAAQRLVDCGVKPGRIHSALYETIAPARMRLLAKVQASLRLVHDERCAFQTMTKAMLTETGANPEDSESFINYPLKCSTVIVSVFLKETSSGVFRCSLRSKGTVDVSQLALAHGGGGHKTAAGFPCPPLPLAELEALLLKSVLELYPKDHA